MLLQSNSFEHTGPISCYTGSDGRFPMILALSSICTVSDASLHSNVVSVSRCQLLPAISLLPLPYLGDNEGQNKHSEDDCNHTGCEWHTESPIHRVFTGLSPISQCAVTHRPCASSRGNHACPVTITPSLSAGGQVVVDASGVRSNGSSRSGHA